MTTYFLGTTPTGRVVFAGSECRWARHRASRLSNTSCRPLSLFPDLRSFVSGASGSRAEQSTSVNLQGNAPKIAGSARCRQSNRSQRTFAKPYRIYTRARVTLMSGGGLSYKDAGVDIDAGNELVRRIRKMNPSIGGFSGMVPFGDSFLVAGTDGVGTKLKLAFDMGKHDTIGIDLVAMSVNDIITAGAKPLFFLDYFATGALDVDVAEAVVKGIVEGCRQSGCPLLGGETAEMPGFYAAGEYDVAGFAVGSVKKDRVIDGSRIKEGDVVLGLASSGVHSNGFSLVRRVLEVSGTKLSDPAPWAGGASFGEALLTPTIIYVQSILALTEKVDVKGLVHMTGGGFPENIPRVIPEGLGVQISKASWEIPPLFRWVQQAGNVSEAEMFRTFNMGVGMVIIVAPDDAETVLGNGLAAFRMGSVVKGTGVDLIV